MKDLIYLAVGDTTVPFGDYEGDTAAYCRGIQKAFAYLGIDTDVTEIIAGMIDDKPQRVQKAFLLRVAGLHEVDIARRLGVHQSTISRYIQQQCGDVRRYLRHRTGILADA